MTKKKCVESALEGEQIKESKMGWCDQNPSVATLEIIYSSLANEIQQKIHIITKKICICPVDDQIFASFRAVIRWTIFAHLKYDKV